MSRTVAGTLYQPDGDKLGPATLTFIAAGTSESVLEGTFIEVSVSSVGVYTTNLLNGNYLVYLDETNKGKNYLGKIAITTGNSVTLNYLLTLSGSSTSQNVIDYITDIVDNLPGSYQPIGDYLGVDYDLAYAPANVTGLEAEIVYRNEGGIPCYGVNLDWDVSSPTIDGDTVKYEIRYYSDTEDPNPTTAIVFTTDYTTPYNLVLWESYTFELRAISIRTGIYCTGVAYATPTVIPEGVPAMDLDDVSDASGLNFIILRWSFPNSAYSLSAYVFLSDTPDFVPSEATLIYAGTGTSFSYYSPDVVNYYVKFILVDSRGNQSVTTAAYGPVSAMRMSNTTIGQLIEANTLEAQHLVDDIDISDKLAAHTVLASKLAVLNLTNLVENHNFTLYTTGADIHDNWTDDGIVNVIDPGPDGYMVLPANARIDNGYTFDCSPGEKIYGAVTLSCTGAGTANKGFTIIFLDADDNILNPDDTDGVEITTGYVATDTSTSLTDELVEGFCLAPDDVVKGYIQLKTEAVATNITFKNATCRYGAAVLIEDGEITADKINVATLWALSIWVEGTLRTYETAGINKGIQLGSAVGLRFYDNSSNLLVDFNPTTGDAIFAGSVSAASLIGTNVLTGNLQLSTTGKLYTAGKTSYTDTTPGIFLGYDTDGYKLNIGSSSKYIKWDGTDIYVTAENRITGPITVTGSWTLWDYDIVNGEQYYTPFTLIDTGVDYTTDLALDGSLGLMPRAVVTSVGTGGSSIMSYTVYTKCELISSIYKADRATNPSPTWGNIILKVLFDISTVDQNGGGLNDPSSIVVGEFKYALYKAI